MAALCCAAALLPARDRRAGKDTPEPYGLIAGTVFREPGYALPGAEVTVTPDPDLPLAGGHPPPRLKNNKAVSDRRGEWAIRVPPGAMRYRIRVAAKGWDPQEKYASFEGQGRVDVSFELRATSK